MNEYEIMINTKDNKGNIIRNDFYLTGTEVAYEKYEGLKELFPDAMVDLIDLETGEILLSTEFETPFEQSVREEAELEVYLGLLYFATLLDSIR